jgi:uncharacterized protein with beta-barrel porin domain
MKKNMPSVSDSTPFARTKLSQAIALACLAIGTTSATAGTGSCAGSGSIVISSPKTGQCELQSGDSLSITSTGKVTTTSGGAVYADNESVGSIVNAGTISATGSGDYGIYVYNGSTVTGNVVNSGLIHNDGSASIYVHGGTTITGSIINSGTIQSDSGKAIYVFNSTIGGNITNSGKLTSDDTGIYVLDSTVEGNITNSGTILSDTYGIYLGSDHVVEGNVTNSGLIESDGYAGIYVYDGTIKGSLINSGTINSGVSARGIYIENTNIEGDIVNSGTLISDYDGIYFYSSTLEGSIINSGLIQTGEQGIYVYYSKGSEGIDGDIINSGTIISEDTGIYVYESRVGGNIENSGTIIANELREGDGHGIYLYYSDIGGNVINSGLINAANTGIYVYAGTTVGAIVNSGTINANLTDIYEQDVNYALGVDDTSTATSITNTGTMSGGIYSDAANNVAVTNQGLVDTLFNASYVNGNYSQTSGGDFRLHVLDPATYGSFTVDGNANFAAGSYLSVSLDPANTIVAGDRLTNVLTVGGTLTQSFTVLDNKLSLAFTSAITGGNVDLVAAGTGLTTVTAAAQSGGFTGGLGAAGAIDNILASDPNGEAAFAFGSLSTNQQVVDALESVVPALNGGVALATMNTVGAFTNIVDSRQDEENGISSGDGFFVSKNLWLKPFGGWTDQDDRDGVRGYEIDSYGLAFGIDGDVSSTWKAGVAMAYSDSDIDGDTVNRQEIHAQSILGKIYATYKMSDATALNLQAGFGGTEYNSDRTIFTGATASADYDSKHYQASAQLSHKFRINEKTTYSPYVHTSYSYIDVDSYNETGAGFFNINADSSSDDTLILGGGVKANHAYSDSLMLLGNAGVGYDVLADTQNLTSSFAGGGGVFTSTGIDPDEIVYDFGLGAKYGLANGTQVTARYDFNGREDYTDMSFSVKIMWMFD